MPVRRNAVRRRQPYRARRRVARKARKVPMSRIPRALRPELKYSDNILTSDPSNGGAWVAASTNSLQDIPFAAATGLQTTFLLNYLDQGTGKDNRLGWKVNNKAINLRAKVTLNAPSTDQLIMCRGRYRIMIYMQKDYSGTYQAACPSATDLLQQNGLSGTDDSAITSFKLDRFKERFVMLHDKVYTPRTTQSGWLNFKINKQLRSQCSYSSSSAHGAAAQYATRGAIYFTIMLGVDGTEGSPTITGSLDLQSRFVFTDA